MHPRDFVFCLLLAVIAAGFVYINWIPQAVFTGLVLVISLTVVATGNIVETLINPLPRVSIPLQKIPEAKKEEKEA